MGKRGKYKRTKDIKKKVSRSVSKSMTTFWKKLKGAERRAYIKARAAKRKATLQAKKIKRRLT